MRAAAASTEIELPCPRLTAAGGTAKASSAPVMSNNSSALPRRDAGRFDDRMMANGGAPSGFGCRGWGDFQRLRPRD